MENQITITSTTTIDDPKPAQTSIKSSHKFDYRVGKQTDGNFRVFFRSKNSNTTVWNVFQSVHPSFDEAVASIQHNIMVDGPALDANITFMDLTGI